MLSNSIAKIITTEKIIFTALAKYYKNHEECRSYPPESHINSNSLRRHETPLLRENYGASLSLHTMDGTVKARV
jgi:hypothetical protein